VAARSVTLSDQSPAPYASSVTILNTRSTRLGSEAVFSRFRTELGQLRAEHRLDVGGAAVLRVAVIPVAIHDRGVAAMSFLDHRRV
jgi:hypothetical protein